MGNSEIVFEVSEDVGGGYHARAIGYDMFTQGETAEELHDNIKEVVDLWFETEPLHLRPDRIRVHYQKDVMLPL